MTTTLKKLAVWIRPKIQPKLIDLTLSGNVPYRVGELVATNMGPGRPGAYVIKEVLSCARYRAHRLDRLTLWRLFVLGESQRPIYENGFLDVLLCILIVRRNRRAPLKEPQNPEHGIPYNPARDPNIRSNYFCKCVIERTPWARRLCSIIFR